MLDVLLVRLHYYRLSSFPTEGDCLPAWVNDVDDHKDALIDACGGGRAVEGAASPVAAFHGEGGR